MGKQYKDELWVDFTEDDFDPAVGADLSAEMKESIEKFPKNRKTAEAFRISKKLVRKSGVMDVRLTDEYFDQLHNKIMSRVKQESVEQSNLHPMIAARGGNRWVRVSLSVAAALVALVSAYSVSQWVRPANVGIPVAREDRALSYERFLQVSQESPVDYARSLVHGGNDEDLLYEVAETRLDNLSDSEFKDFLAQ